MARDPLHCGSCENACPAALRACVHSTCVPALTTAWEVHFGAGSFPGFAVEAVTTDADGNVYVAGFMNFEIDLGGGPLSIPGGGGAADIVVASFTPAGAHRWSRVFGSPAIDAGRDLVLSQGMLYVLGTFQRTVDFGGGPLTSAGGEDLVVLGLDPATGGYVSARGYGTRFDDEAFSIAADAAGNVIIGGSFQGPSLDVGGGPLTGGGSLFNGFIAAFTPAGAHVWSRAVLAVRAGLNFATPVGLAVDLQGNVVIAGSFTGAGDFGTGPATAIDSDLFAASYTPAGALRWVRHIAHPGADGAGTVATDGAGNVFVGGAFAGPAIDLGTGPIATAAMSDGIVAALDADTGATRFARALGSSRNASVSAVAVAQDGNLLATGSVEGEVELGLGPTETLGSLDIFLASFSGATGAIRWGKRYGGRGFEQGLAIAGGPRGEVIVGGETHSNPTDLGTGPFAILGTADNGYAMKVVP